MAAEEHRVPTVSWLELGGGQQGQEDGERGRKWGECIRTCLLKWAHSRGDQQGHVFWEGDPSGALSRAPLPRKFQGWRLEVSRHEGAEGVQEEERKELRGPRREGKGR